LKINNWISIAGRIDDGEPEFEDDSWFTRTAREGEDIPLRADRWFQSADVERMVCTHSRRYCQPR